LKLQSSFFAQISAHPPEALRKPLIKSALPYEVSHMGKELHRKDELLFDVI